MSFGIAGLGALLFGGGGGSVVGLAAALAAAFRGEPRRGLTVAGFLINLPLAGLLALVVLKR